MQDALQERIVLWFAGLSLIDEKYSKEFARLLHGYGQAATEAALIEAATRYKFVPILYEALSHIEHSIPTRDLEKLARIHGIGNSLLIASTEALRAELAARSVQFMLLKGLDFSLSLYPPGLARTMDDVDILVRRDDLKRACEAFYDLGFVHGGRVLSDNSFHEATPEELARQYEDHPYQLYPLFKRVTARELLPHVDTIRRWLPGNFYFVTESLQYMLEYDLHFNVSAAFEEDEAWANPRSITLPSGSQALALGVTQLLLVLAEKLYHEVMMLNEMNLRMFIDLLMLVKKHAAEIDWERCTLLAAHYQVGPALFYCLWHANQIVPGIPDSVLVSLLPTAHTRDTDYGDFLAKLLGTWACIPTPVDCDGAAALVGQAS